MRLKRQETTSSRPAFCDEERSGCSEKAMPRYYFETKDNDEHTGDDEGSELAGPRAARREALSALPDMARDSIPNGDDHAFYALVKDANGEPVFEGTLTLRGRWLKKP